MGNYRTMVQDGDGPRGFVVVLPGGPVEVDVGPNDTEVVTNDPARGEIRSARVPPGKKMLVPIPAVPPGTVLFVSTGIGLRTEVIVVEVVEPS